MWTVEVSNGAAVVRVFAASADRAYAVAALVRGFGFAALVRDP